MVTVYNGVVTDIGKKKFGATLWLANIPLHANIWDYHVGDVKCPISKLSSESLASGYFRVGAQFVMMITDERCTIKFDERRWTQEEIDENKFRAEELYNLLNAKDGDTMGKEQAKTGFDSTQDTLEHIAKVVSHGREFVDILTKQLEKHDASKLRDPEKKTFDEISPRLKKHQYGSPEYEATLKEMQEGLAEHYKNNSHHPEHTKDGIAGMTLFDLVEMFIDWKAATERTKGGDLKESLKKQETRFDMQSQLTAILRNTVKKMGW
jgi:hypothetical protein